MKLSVLPLPFLVAASLVTSIGLRAADIALTPDNTTVKFLGTKKDGKHEGSFKKLAGTYSVDGDIARSKLAVTIDIDSMVTDAPKLTAHLKAPDFFDAKRFPQAKFVSKTIKADGDSFVVSGDLTMHGVTAPLSFPAKIALVEGGATVSAQFDLNRQDWGISYGKGKVDDLVKMTIQVKAK